MHHDRRRFIKEAGLFSAAIPAAGLIPTSPAFTFEDMAGSFGASWRRSKTYMMEVARAMPAESYGFRPTPEVRSFAEQMLHVAAAVYGFSSVIKGEAMPVDPALFNPRGKEKEEILAVLQGALDYAASAVAELTEVRATETQPWQGRLYDDLAQMPLFGVVRVLHDHTTHHRAQAVLYLRMQGVTPPTYVD